MAGQEQHDSKWHRPLRKLIKKTHDENGRAEAVSNHADFKVEDLNPAATQAGPHADEKRMPRWLIRVLEKGDKVKVVEIYSLDGALQLMSLKVVETPGLVPVLAQLAKAHPGIKRATYCSPHVHHVAKLRREGSFCGYRNIQMMVSYIRNSKSCGYQYFDDKPLPSIFALQDMIETAWDHGLNSSSRDEIGHVRMTRKFIGTSEAEAIFLDLKVSVTTRAFISSANATAFELLTRHIADYFATSTTENSSVSITSKPPIFLQRPGHSMTIVGIDQDYQGTPSLIIFDPRFEPAKALKMMATSRPSLAVRPEKLLKAHRYGVLELGKFDAFEVVEVRDTASPSI